MNQYSYHSYEDNSPSLIMCNRKSDNVMLTVNCFGHLCLKTDFNTLSCRNDWYLLIMESGRLEISLESEKKFISEGEAVIFPPGYTYNYNNKNCSNIKYYWLHFTGGYIEQYLEALKLKELKIIRKVSIAKISELFDKTYLNTLGNNDFTEIELSILAYNALLIIARGNLGDNKNRLTKSLSYISENYTKDIPVSVLAEIEKISISRYNFLFRELTGESPVKYITGLRLNKSRYLLETTGLTISQISDMCGFSDPHYFHKIFKKYFGVTPSKNRKRC